MKVPDRAIESGEEFRRERDTRVVELFAAVLVGEDGGIVEEALGCHSGLEVRDLA